jgi:hypothetical protein
MTGLVSNVNLGGERPATECLGHGTDIYCYVSKRCVNIVATHQYQPNASLNTSLSTQMCSAAHSHNDPSLSR